MNILFDEYGFTIDTEWLYFTINWLLIGIVLVGFVGYKVYKKYFVKLEREKTEWEQ